MKARSIVVGFVILTLICSSALAISKSDLISYYRKEPSSLSNSNNQEIPDEPTQTTPKVLPTPQSDSIPFPKWTDLTILKPFSKPCVPSSPIIKPSLIPITKSCPPAIPSRPLYRAMVYCGCEGTPVCECVNPETGEHYPIGFDGQGNTYYIKPGCQYTWAD
jgi:hypothetical protein